MVRRKKWTHTEKLKLAENYETATIKELMEMLPDRTADMINAQIKRLKKVRKIEGRKEEINKIPKQFYERPWFESCKIE